VEGGVCGQDRAVAEVAEAFAGLALEGVALDDRAEHFDGAVHRRAGRHEPVEAGAIVGGADIEGVFVWGFADEADFAEVGSGAAVRATGDADADGIVGEAVLLEDGFEFFQQLGQGAFALGEGEAAGGQGHAGEGVQTQAGAVVFLVETVLGEDRLDEGLLRGGDAGDGEVLRRSEAEVTGVNFSDFAESSFHRPAFLVDDASAKNVQAVEPSAIGALVPTEGILNRGEMEVAGRTKDNARALLDLAFEPHNAAILDGVFQTRMLAVRAVAEVSLGGENDLSNFVDLVGSDEAQNIGQAREGFGISMAHSETATDRDIVADELAVFDDRDVAEILRKDIHIV